MFTAEANGEYRPPFRFQKANRDHIPFTH